MPKSANNHRTLGEMIRTQRKILRIGQRELAKQLGVSQPTVLRIERGAEPKISLLEKIAVVLQMDLGELHPSYPKGLYPVEIRPISVAESMLLERFRLLETKERRSFFELLFSMTDERWLAKRRAKRASETKLPEHDETAPVVQKKRKKTMPPTTK